LTRVLFDPARRDFFDQKGKKLKYLTPKVGNGFCFVKKVVRVKKKSLAIAG